MKSILSLRIRTKFATDSRPSARAPPTTDHSPALHAFEPIPIRSEVIAKENLRSAKSAAVFPSERKRRRARCCDEISSDRPRRSWPNARHRRHSERDNVRSSQKFRAEVRSFDRNAEETKRFSSSLFVVSNYFFDVRSRLVGHRDVNDIKIL